MTRSTATVFLVGAGPGDPGLITLRGLDLLRSAEVVLYDRLVDPRLVDEAPDAAERLFVGKKPGGPSMPQAEIDALIVERARQGKRVVRLKGGDPFVFGRGADEAQALAAAGITFEIVPGVTSAIAVPAYAGIPVTHSGASSSFAVLTAHESSPRPDEEQRWMDVARGAGTLILLMGVAGLDATTQRLIQAGRDPEEPVAVIERGTTRDQRTIVGTIKTITEAASAAGVASPAITIVGPVVRLRDALNWFESKPLFGRRIVITRPRDDAQELRAELERLGGEVVVMPLIVIEPLADTSELDEALGASGFDWIVFSSHNAADSVTSRLRALGAKLVAKVAAVGPRTVASLREAGIEVDVAAADATGRGVAEALGPGAGRALVPVSEGKVSRAANELEERGWTVVRAPAYRTVPALPGDRQAAIVVTRDYDAILFASGSAAEAFAAMFEPVEGFGLDPGTQDGPKVVAGGPSTAATLSGCGLRVDAVAGDPTVHGLVHAVLGLPRSQALDQ